MEISDDKLISSLRNAAEVDAQEGEYNRAEHCAWMAAERLLEVKEQRDVFLRVLVEVAHDFAPAEKARQFLLLTHPMEYRETLLAVLKAEHPEYIEALQAAFGDRL